MPLNKLSQKSFVNGQYDRTAQNQESISGGNIVASGLSYAINVLSSDKGELRKRLGTKYLAELPGATVLIPFRMPDDNDVILTANSSNVKGIKYANDGTIMPLLSVTPDSSVAFPAGNTWGNGTMGANTVANGDWVVSFDFNYSQFYPGALFNNSNGYMIREGTNIVVNAPRYISIRNSNTACCLRSIKVWFWTNNSTTYLYKFWSNPSIQYSDDGVTWFAVQTDYRVEEYTPVSYTASQKITTPGGTITIPANYKSKCSMTISQSNYGVNHNYWRIYFQSGSTQEGYILIDNTQFVNVGTQTEFNITSPYTEEQLKRIKYAQDKNEMFIACEDVIPYKFLNNNGQLTLTAFTPANTASMWTNTGGYPSAVAMFQNRLWFGGFENKPTNVVASKFGDYETFNVSSPVQKDDRLDLTCNQLKSRIRNMVGGQNILYCFSQDGISNVDGGSTGMLATNENIEFILKNRMPAGDATPAFKDDVMLYSSSDGTKLYGVDFDLLVNRFQVSDLAKYAKDVTKAKITELHYINNEAKLVYGLTDEGTMFALLFEKGQYQGFFPMDTGGIVYDICPVKVGRDYKLLMVVLRDGNWYLEEKLDVGNYIDTSKPRMTGEEKKWATYDNLENNIALDCYQTYDEGFDAVIDITSETTMVSDVDLTAYINKTVMLCTEDNKDFIICVINSCELNDGLYYIDIMITVQRGSATRFINIYPEFTEFKPNLPQTADIGVISEGRYFNATKPDIDELIYLPAPCHKVIYGVVYESLAILKIQAPYESLKNVAQIDVSVINTTHLELGTDFEHTESIEKIDDSSYYDLTRITMNDVYRQVVSDTPESTKNIILRSNKGVPFTLTAIDIYINYSNLGGD